MADLPMEAVEYLPEDGSEITYDEWRNRLLHSENPMLARQTHNCRRRKLVTFRVEIDPPTQEITGHFVKRAKTGGV